MRPARQSLLRCLSSTVLVLLFMGLAACALDEDGGNGRVTPPPSPPFSGGSTPPTQNPPANDTPVPGPITTTSLPTTCSDTEVGNFRCKGDIISRNVVRRRSGTIFRAVAIRAGTVRRRIRIARAFSVSPVAYKPEI